jgi:hypothetical protein
MDRRRGYWDGTEVVEKGSGSRSQVTVRRAVPTLEPLEETGEFRSWYRGKFGRDPVTLSPVFDGECVGS